MSKMHTSVCRFRLGRNSPWEPGIMVRIATPDTRDNGSVSADDTVTIIGTSGNVYFPNDVDSFDEQHDYGSFTFDPDNISP